MNADKPVLGIFLMLMFCVLAPMGDALAKLLGAAIPILMLLTVRFGAQVLLLAPIVAVTGTGVLTRRLVRLTAVRTVLHICGIGLMFTALRYLPLAEAVAIAFVMPFLMLLLGWFYLGEEVGIRRILASVVGFAGTLLVVQPTFAEVGWPALLPLGVAVVFALFMLVTRSIAKEIDAVVLQAVSGAMALPILGVAWLLFGNLPGMGFVVPAPLEWWLLAALGAVGTLAHLMMTWSLRFAPSTTLAPMQYLEIPIAAIVGLAIFGDFPNGLALVGIAITIAAGLYILARERAVSRAAVPLSRPPAPPAAE